MWRPRLPRFSRKALFIAAPLLLGGGGAAAWWYFELPPFSSSTAGPPATADGAPGDDHGAKAEPEGEHGAKAESNDDHGAKAEPEGEHGAKAESKGDHGDSAEAAGGHGEAADAKADAGHGAAKTAEPSEVTMPETVFPAPARGNALVQQVRGLVTAQANAARGDDRAAADQRRQILEVLKVVEAMDPAAMTAQDVQALALFALSGGPVQLIDEKRGKIKVAPSLLQMLEGAIAYSRGDKAAATPLLRAQDFTTLPAPLSAMLALAQFEADEELPVPEKYRRLTFAASTLPGTLVEEAALRRLAELAAAAGDQERFYLTVDRYLRRFARSAYSQEFRDVVFAGLSKLEVRNTAAQRPQLTRFLDKLPADAGLELGLFLALQALRAGNASLCLFMVDRAKPLRDGMEEAEAQRLKLYEQACRLVAAERPSLPEGLSEPPERPEPPENLPKEDRSLWQAVQALDGLIWEEAVIAKPKEDVRPPPLPEEDDSATLEASVTQQLRAIDELIAKVPP